MRTFLIFLIASITFQVQAQSKKDYLQTHRYDIQDDQFLFPEDDFKIIGFGAYHGSAKTEVVEHCLLNALTSEGKIKYYLPETDYSTAHYYDRYLKTGDETLLKDLVYHSGVTVAQERTIEVFEKWRNLKKMNDALPEEDKLTVVGVDIILSYKYSVKHILELVQEEGKQFTVVKDLKNALDDPDTDFSSFKDSQGKGLVKAFVADVDARLGAYRPIVKDEAVFHHILENIRTTLGVFSGKREATIFNNYVALSAIYNFKENPQFMRIGFAHLEKEREGQRASFFTQLIEKEVYKRDEVIAVIGYLTNSEVLWDQLYDDAGDYTGYTTEAGFGIGDYEDEYFRGIQHLKNAKISDMTLFQLNDENTPYNNNEPDLIEVILSQGPSNGERVAGKSTTAFLDYAILISDSKASTPIEELDRVK
jgi:hypothetical protein